MILPLTGIKTLNIDLTYLNLNYKINPNFSDVLHKTHLFVHSSLLLFEQRVEL